MSRKSRQRTAAKQLMHVAPPRIALFIAIVGLLFGTVMAVPTRIVTRDESIPVTAALSGVEANLRSVRRLERSNATGAFVSIPFFAMGGYGLWSLLRCWQYRRVLHSHL